MYALEWRIKLLLVKILDKKEFDIALIFKVVMMALTDFHPSTR